MLFCSEKFLLFFGVVFSLYWTLPWPRMRVGVLLGASFWFFRNKTLSVILDR